MRDLPDSRAAREAEALLRLTSPAHLVNHCLRSYSWALAVAELDDVAFDPEVLFVAAALHDLGLLEEFDCGDPFETDGARVAHAFAVEHGMSGTRADDVRRAVECHVAREVAEGDGPESYLLWHGTGIDVSGSRVDELDPPFIASVLGRYPREDFRTGFGALLRYQAWTKRGSRAAELVAAGLIDRLENSPLERGAWT